ncbi:hypothetical protein BLNAU_23618 [Blattamonas nauphoetae]|uniref:Uncharacterized protein n=1 Tax=Blattamonas nauphoetae TaxID=2049346 RepID=A0ABQ9WSP3_9EUKA|nr:hypothetical protein BLNAU_23618 [Blattamonas nauphoetae]
MEQSNANVHRRHFITQLNQNRLLRAVEHAQRNSKRLCPPRAPNRHVAVDLYPNQQRKNEPDPDAAVLHNPLPPAIVPTPHPLPPASVSRRSRTQALVSGRMLSVQ